MKFDEQHYPQPKEMMDQLHSEDLHMMISVWSRFGEDTDVYKRMKARLFSFRGKSGRTSLIPQAQTTFWSELNKGIFQVGMDGWWMDASEPEFDVLKGRQTFLGSGESVRNAYPLYVTKAIYEGQRATTDRKRVVILTRSAFAGQQRNAAASWSGDITRRLDYTAAADSRGPELQHVRNAVLDDGYRRLLSAQGSIHFGCVPRGADSLVSIWRVLSDFPRPRICLECRDLELRSTSRKTSSRNTMSCDIVCCLISIPPPGASPATAKRSCGRCRWSFPLMRAREASRTSLCLAPRC